MSPEGRLFGGVLKGKAGKRHLGNWETTLFSKAVREPRFRFMYLGNKQHPKEAKKVDE
jgi:hypothetical protein